MYFEDKKLVEVEDVDGGEKRLTVDTGVDADGNPTMEKFNVPAWEYEVNSAEEPIDASSARNNRAIYVVDKIYDIFKSLDITVEDIGYICQKLIAKTQGIEEQARLNSFGKADAYDVRVSDWENKL